MRAELTRVRLPRTRGDGPKMVFARLNIQMAPPHTRGWTPRTDPPARDGCGSPAHAGMDPTRAPGRSSGRRLPRTRGDGPRTGLRSAPTSWAPPHTRGWTARKREVQRARVGSPAHAGMDPATRRSGKGSKRLPRTRGDGPQSARAVLRQPEAPPHTRGWTPRDASDVRARRGSPAHAGMDPEREAVYPFRLRLPRTRGDGPWGRDRRHSIAPAPPHTRGWTSQ